MKTRANLLWSLGLLIIIFGLLFQFYGYDKTWKLWNISTMSPCFADTRVITAGADSRAQGYDPLIKNPGDPWNRRLNYPRVWQLLFSLGVNQGHTIYLGIGFIFLFLVGICLICPRISNTTLVFIMGAIVSPAVLLGVERANTDLLMFFLLAVAVVAVKRRHLLSTTVILFGFILKLYPVFGLIVLLRQKRSVFFVSSAISIVFALIYASINFEEILMIIEATWVDTFFSYGLNIFGMRVMRDYPAMEIYAKILSYLLALSSLVYALSALLRNDLPQEDQELPYLDSFRAGSAIYLGTFLLGSNWDYRLMFLIFTIPQLLLWSNFTSRSVSWISRLTLFGLYTSMWFLLIVGSAQYIPHGASLIFLLDQISKWLIFAGLLYLLFLSMPPWVKQYAAELKSLMRYFTQRLSCCNQ